MGLGCWNWPNGPRSSGDEDDLGWSGWVVGNDCGAVRGAGIVGGWQTKDVETVAYHDVGDRSAFKLLILEREGRGQGQRILR